MKTPLALARRLSIGLLMLTSLLLAAACSEDPTPTPTSDPTPTAVPTATPAPTPTPTTEEILAAAGAKVVAMESAKFGMTDETETGALFFGTTFKSMEAEVEAPASIQMLVNVIAPGFGFIEIEIIKVGEQAFIKLSRDAPWNPLPPDQVPFNFAGMGIVFGTLPNTIQDVTLTGREEVQGAQTVRIEGVIDSEELLPLITSANPGHPVTLTLWIDEAELLLRQVRLAGQIYDDDAPETTRLLTIDDINVPVDIELPDVASGR